MKVKIYGADWCIDCINAKNLLISRGVSFEYVVITNNQEAISFLEKVNDGKRIIPTIIIDNKIYSNPGIDRLILAIGE